METGAVEVVPRGRAGHGGLSPRKIYAAIPLIPIAILSIIVVSLTGNSYEKGYDDLLLSYTAPAATFAIAAVIAGLWYALGKAESGASAGSASATALASWALGIVAFGFACKLANYGDLVPGELKALLGMTILLFLFETLYVILLHLVLVWTS
ncbi:hypothetical protein R1flu_005081 [Riccia fluitans]|uniref:Uncharacterized protein n=1 Tax=Riccia fluitans TaxID=41844 RepID=A0ABD1YS51_9MARC